MSKERKAVERAVLDYVESAYTVDPALVERSVHPRLAKLGFVQKDGQYIERPMTLGAFVVGGNTESSQYPPPPTRRFSALPPNAPIAFEELVEVVKVFNRDGQIPQDAPKRVTVYEVLDQTASAKLEAWWGIDYIHLAKFDGKWMIVNVLWQTLPNDS